VRWGGKVIALFVWAPQPISGVYIVKSATRLINSGNLHIKNPDAVYLDLRDAGAAGAGERGTGGYM
jgi:hypothetical protein